MIIVVRQIDIRLYELVVILTLQIRETLQMNVRLDLECRKLCQVCFYVCM